MLSQIDRLDARENARREEFEQRILKSPEADKEGAWQEEHTKRELFERDRRIRLTEANRIEQEVDSRPLYELESLPPSGLDRSPLDNLPNLPSLSSSLQVERPGRDVPPLETEHPLKYVTFSSNKIKADNYIAHANVHSNRPYFCPSKTCLRSEALKLALDLKQ